MRIGRESSEMRVPVSGPWVTRSWRAVRARPRPRARPPPGTSARKPAAPYRSDRTTRSENSTKIQRRAKKPALVSCSTSSGTSRRTPPSTRRADGPDSLTTEHQAGVPDPDHVAVVELPRLDRVPVHGGAVGRPEVRQRGVVTIPVDLEVAARHAGVGQAERGVLPTTDDVGALGQLVAATGAVVQADGGRQLLLVAVPSALLLAVAGLLTVAALLVRVVAAVVALVVGRLVAAALLAVALVVAGLAVAGLRRVGLRAAVAGLALRVVAGVVALRGAALLGVAGVVARVSGLAGLTGVVALRGALGVAALRGVARLAVALGLALVVTTAALVVALGGVRLLTVAGGATVVAVVAVLLRVARLLAHGCFSCVACSDGVPAGSVGVHGRAGAELSRVQRIGALQEDYDLAVGVPPLVGELLGDRAGQRIHDLRPVTPHASEIGGAEQHREPVGRQQAAPGELLDMVLGFPQQRLHNFLGNDTATEDPREGVAHQSLK